MNFHILVHMIDHMETFGSLIVAFIKKIPTLKEFPLEKSVWTF